MFCDCIKKVEASCYQNLSSQMPEGSRVTTALLQGRMTCIDPASKVGRAAVNEYTANQYLFEYEQPKKKGDGFTKKKARPSIRHTYCPFCGLHVETGKPAPSSAEAEGDDD